MEPTSVSSRITLDSAGRIDQDLPCLGCGYNLRGLPPDGRCPECDAPIERSLQGDYLQFSDPRWLARLQSGAAWIQWAAIVPIILFLLGSIVLDALLRHKIIRAVEAIDLSPVVWNLIPLLGAILVGMRGCWKVTATEPGKSDHTRSVRTSRAARVIITCMCFVWLGSIVVFESVPRSWQIVPTIALYVCWPIGYLALLTHLRELALRMPDPQLARDTRIAIVGAIALNVFFGIWLFFTVGHCRKHLREVRQKAIAANIA